MFVVTLLVAQLQIEQWLNTNSIITLAIPYYIAANLQKCGLGQLARAVDDGMCLTVAHTSQQATLDQAGQLSAVQPDAHM